MAAGRSKEPEAVLWKRAFGERVRGLRKERSLSQDRLAEKVGVHRTYMGAVGRGEQNISLTNIHEIARALNVPVRDLFD